jgi:hypothetical protein
MGDSQACGVAGIYQNGRVPFYLPTNYLGSVRSRALRKAQIGRFWAIPTQARLKHTPDSVSSTNINDANFGTVTVSSTNAPPREVQLNARFNF